MHRIGPQIERARVEGRGLVALESTLIAHGLPWPANLETALACEATVAATGAVAATVAVLGGRACVGLDPAELERVARSAAAGGPKAGSFRKASRRDLAAAAARGLDAATTVSGTLWIARQAGLNVMATGGLGGVHRDAATTFDVSNDLDELARADGALVVCSGVKSILDMAATLDALETRGVLVVAYRTDTLPAFTTSSSGLGLEHRVDSPDEAAGLVRAHRRLGLPGAIVLAQPVPEAVALDREEMEEAMAAALDEAHDQGVAGKAITPFLLGRLEQLTGGRSLAANRALVIANAGLAGKVASALASDVQGSG